VGYHLTPPAARQLLPAVLSTTAGAVDVIGFVAFGGLFTAHVTGNLVVIAMHYVTGRDRGAGPVLAVPVFMALVAAVTLASAIVKRAGFSPLRGLLVLQAALLGAASCWESSSGRSSVPSARSL
jgi:uncharacterized membrane protein YoaK (UPF0700 family)